MVGESGARPLSCTFPRLFCGNARVPLPERAAIDALHVAIAAVHGMDYLLTWNCTHIANATLREPIESVCRASGYDTAGDLHAGGVASRGRRLNVDDVLRAVRNAREAYAQQFGYDLQAIHRDLKAQEQASGRRIVSLPPRRPKPATANGARCAKVEWSRLNHRLKLTWVAILVFRASTSLQTAPAA